MARDDMATPEREAFFAGKKAEILAATVGWDKVARKYLEEVLNELGSMTAFYSYGNGQIDLGNDPMWDSLNPDIIPKINDIIKPSLDIVISNNGSFPSSLWFEWGDLEEQ